MKIDSAATAGVPPDLLRFTCGRDVLEDNCILADNNIEQRSRLFWADMCFTWEVYYPSLPPSSRKVLSAYRQDSQQSTLQEWACWQLAIYTIYNPQDSLSISPLSNGSTKVPQGMHVWISKFPSSAPATACFLENCKPCDSMVQGMPCSAGTS